VYDEALRIPLMFLSYGYDPQPFGNHRRAVAQVDIAPTILAEFGMALPKTWAGVPLQELDTRSYTYFQEGDDVGLIDYRDGTGVLKFWTNTRSKHQFAFDVIRDETEKSNAIDALPLPYVQDLRFRLMQQRSVSSGTH
jgi:arylsulfatase A-like enzyme